MKYVGSKAGIIRHIAPIIHNSLSTGNGAYVEPFVGGGNSIVRINANKRIGADANRYVISLLSELRDGWIPPDISREEYTDIRDHKDSYDDHLVGWAGVGCSYSGKWFGGYAGLVKTRDGIRDYISEARRNVLAQAPLLTGVDLRHCDYENLSIQDGSVIYCDPPYANTLKYPGEFDTRKFWLWCEDMSRFNSVLVSEYEAPEGWSTLWHGMRGSSLSANGSVGGHKMCVEKLYCRLPKRKVRS